MLEQLMKELDEANEKADRLRATLRDAETILARCYRINAAPTGKQIEAMQQYIHGALLKAETLNEAVEDIANYLQREFTSKKTLRDWLVYCKERGYINPKVADGVAKRLDTQEKPPKGGSETPAFDAAIRSAQAMFKAPY